MRNLRGEFQHTGTWIQYDEADEGRFFYGNSTMDGVMNGLLRARWFAGSAEERIISVLGDSEAASSPLLAQTRLGGALADLFIGITYCEAPALADGPAVSDMDILAQAIQKLTATIATANAAGRTDYAMAATAARARAKLVMGDYAGAAVDAKLVPDGFAYYAKFNANNTNSVVTLVTATFNKAAGLREKWWPLIDNAGGPTYMRDPYTNELDSRKPVFFDGSRSTDNITPHYSQWKYTSEVDDIPLFTSGEMRLIEAEALMRSGTDYTATMAILNQLRTAAGLTPLAVPTDATAMRDILLSEREAELFMTGMRAVDLYRFGVTKEIFNAMNDVERPGTGRPTKYPMSSNEALYNNNIADDLGQRCLPKTN